MEVRARIGIWDYEGDGAYKDLNVVGIKLATSEKFWTFGSVF